MATLAEKKEELEALLQELEASENAVIQKKVKAYREKFLVVSVDEVLGEHNEHPLIIELKLVQNNIKNLNKVQLTSKVALSLKSTIEALKEKIDLIDTSIAEYDKIEEKWAILGVEIKNLAEYLILNEGDEIENVLEEESVDEEEKVKDLLDNLKEIYNFLSTAYKVIKGEELEIELLANLEEMISLKKKQEKLGETKSVNLDLNIVHYEKKIDFKKKEKLIKKAVDEIIASNVPDDSVEITEEVLSGNLNKEFKEKLKKELDKLDAVLEKEEKRGDGYSIKLPVFF